MSALFEWHVHLGKTQSEEEQKENTENKILYSILVNQQKLLVNIRDFRNATELFWASKESGGFSGR
jgi:hypothetical protein